MSLYSQLAELLQYISPNFYKKRFFKKLLNLNENNFISRNIEPEMLWIKTFLKEDSVFIDIGANVGAYIYVLENVVKPENIYAFEPNIRLNKRLKSIFPGINISDFALSDDNRMTTFKIPVIKGKSIHTRGTLKIDYKEKEEEKSILQEIKVKKLDDVNINFTRIDFIKIDVEGNEIKTLNGAKNTILKHQPTLMVEIEQRHHQQPIWNLIIDIESWGYKAYYLNRDTLKLDKLTEELILLQNHNNIKNYKLYINNIIFLPNRHLS